MQRTHVAIGIIVNEKQQVCIAQRAQTAHLGGLWEFPGGKVEDCEDALAALHRELHEELRITVNTATPFKQLPFDYPDDDQYVLLDFWLVDDFSGEPHGAEGQPVRWVSMTQLDQIDFPEANQPIVALLQEHYCAA